MSVLALGNLSKSYGPTKALSGFSLDIGAGEVVALVGENGAGKSTIAKLLAGAETPDSGVIALGGKPLHLASPREAMRAGISLLPQELAPVPTLTLGENLFVGDWPSVWGFISRRRLYALARQELTALGFADLDVTRRADTVSLADLQLIEIAKAVRRQARVIVFDEPSAALSEAETQILHRIITTVSGHGVAVVYISHRMDEVFTFSSRICVLRNGRKVGEHATAGVSRDTIVEEMVGRRISAVRAGSGAGAREALLSVEGCWRSERPPVADVSLALHKGEIVGLYGLRGSGADVIAAIIGGQIHATAGHLRLAGALFPLPRHPIEAKRMGIHYIPASRKTEGLVLGLSVADNISLPNLELISRAGFLLPGRQGKIVSRLIGMLRVRLRSASQPVGELSGGNQQKVLLASRLVRPDARILVLQEPTRGVDVGSRAEIHAALRELAAAGAGIIICSSDVDEVVSVCDRVLVVRGGRIVTSLEGADRTEANAVSAAGSDVMAPLVAG